MKLSEQQRNKRTEARRKILEKANAVRAYNLPQLTRRHLHEAVRIVRHRRLVSKKVLTEAGFRHAKNT